MARVERNFRRSNTAKQYVFALARTLTTTAKQAQTGIIAELGDKFTLRNNWFNPSTPKGVKVKPATKTKLESQVGSDYDALEKFETGKTKRPSGQHIAVPTTNVRRNKRDIITRAQRPAALRSKRTFVARRANGAVLYLRKFKGRRSQLVPLYNLARRAKIQKKSPIIEPTKKIAAEKLNPNFDKFFNEALATTD